MTTPWTTSLRFGVLATATVAVLFGSSTAFAHIDPDPTEAQAGSRLSVGFTVEHGCDGSPTTALDMRLPDGVTDATPEPPEGWVASVDADVVTFTGGPLPDDQELTFGVAMNLPATPDSTIYFPFVQRCEVGEIRWIDVPTDESGEELDEPAPAMQLFGPVATTVAPPVTTVPATTVPATVEPVSTDSPVSIEEPIATGEPVTSTDTGSEATATTEASTDTVAEPPSSGAEPNSVPGDDGSDDGGSSSTVAIIAVVAALVLVGAVTAVFVRRQKSG